MLEATAVEPDATDAAAAVYPAHQCLLKKAENHAHAVSLFFLYYNYCRPHQTLTKAASGVKTTPAMASGLTDHVWTVKDTVELMNPERRLG
jgi:hypothetical protein